MMKGAGMGQKYLIAAVSALLLASGPALAGSYRMMFDIFSPGGIECTASPPPGGAVRLSRGIAGNPVVSVYGSELRQAEITCTMPDGSRWQATGHRILRPGTMRAEGKVLIRAGAPAGVTLLEVDGRDEAVMRSFVPLR